jgi:hypothetical protein
MARVAAGAFGFLTLIQVFDGPDRYAAQYRLAWRWTGKNCVLDCRDPRGEINIF